MQRAARRRIDGGCASRVSPVIVGGSAAASKIISIAGRAALDVPSVAVDLRGEVLAEGVERCVEIVMVRPAVADRHSGSFAEPCDCQAMLCWAGSTSR